MELENAVRTDGVIFADVVEREGHFHVQWCCPDCSRVCFVALQAKMGSFRTVCCVTGREFLVFPGDLADCEPAECRQGDS